MTPNTKHEYRICCSTVQGPKNYSDNHAEAAVMLTVADHSGERLKDYQSVEVKVVFDPATKTWSAEVVKAWEGRF